MGVYPCGVVRAGGFYLPGSSGGDIVEIKLLKKGIKIDGKYFPVWYSSSEGNTKGNATIYWTKKHLCIGRLHIKNF